MYLNFFKHIKRNNGSNYLNYLYLKKADMLNFRFNILINQINFCNYESTS